MLRFTKIGLTAVFALMLSMTAAVFYFVQPISGALPDIMKGIPSDKALLDNFRKNRACFEQIVTMAQLEKDVVERITTSDVFINHRKPLPDVRRTYISDDRWNTYKNLLECVHIPLGIIIGGKDRIYFRAAVIGIFNRRRK
jgi:hypothetical protein